MAASNFLEDQLVRFLYMSQSYTPPETLYVSLYNSDPADDDSGLEVSGSGYARQSSSFGLTANNGEVANTAKLEFPTAQEDWGTVTHFGVHDAVSAGNLLSYASLNSSKSVASGSDAFFNSGTLSCSFV